MPLEDVDELNRKKDMRLTMRLLNILGNKTEALLTSGQFQLADEEKQLIAKSRYNALSYQLVGGALILFIMKKNRDFYRLTRMMHGRDHMTSRNPPSSNPSSETVTHVKNSPFNTGVNYIPTNSHNPNEFQSPFTENRDSRTSSSFSWAYFIRCVTDTLLAFSITFTTVVCSNVEAVRHASVNLPLVPGTGPLSKELCGPMLAEFEKAKKESKFLEMVLNRGIIEKEPSSRFEHPLIMYARLVKNCQLRASFEEQFRVANGMSVNEPVSIPQPGLPGAFKDAGFSMSAVGATGTSSLNETTMEDEFSADAFDSSKDDWADKLTTDQEDSLSQEKRGQRRW